MDNRKKTALKIANLTASWDSEATFQFSLYAGIVFDSLQLVKKGIVRGVYKRDWDYFQEVIIKHFPDTEIAIKENLLIWIICTAFIESQRRGILEPMGKKLGHNIYSDKTFTDSVNTIKTIMNKMNRRSKQMSGKKLSPNRAAIYSALDKMKINHFQHFHVQLSDRQIVQMFCQGTKTLNEETKLYNSYKKYHNTHLKH